MSDTINRKSNPSSLQAQNPLIGVFPGDTMSTVSSVLAYLQFSVSSDWESGLEGDAQTGLHTILSMCHDALVKQSAVL